MLILKLWIFTVLVAVVVSQAISEQNMQVAAEREIDESPREISNRPVVFAPWSDWGPCIWDLDLRRAIQIRHKPLCAEHPCYESQECELELVTADTSNRKGDVEDVILDPVVTFGQWSSWGSCSASCGGGTRNRTREICPSDAECSENTSIDICNIQKCPTITIAPWSNWERCSVSCGGGIQYRSREICAGLECREDTTSRNCSNHTCPDCQGEWTAWFDRDDPSGNGDYEILVDLRKARKLEVCLSPSLIDGRVVGVHTNWKHTGDNVSSSLTYGLSCINKNQKHGRYCKDYEVRYCCPKIENRKEVQFVATTFLRTILTVAGVAGSGSSQSQGDCKRRGYSDSSNNLRMTGKACKSGRRKRQVSQNDPQITKRDILFLIDESGSVGADNFEKFKRLAKAMVKTFCGDIDIGDKKTRVGFLTFDSTQHPHLNFNDTFNDVEILRKIGDIRYDSLTAGYTCLIPTLEYVRRSMFTPARGARIAEPGTEQVLILFTDGCANCKPYRERFGLLESLGNKFRQQRISVITFLVGSHTSDCIDQISSLSEGTHCYQGFLAYNWDEVDYFIQNIEAATCNTEWKLSVPCVDP